MNVRTYDIPLYPNTGKLEAIRYTAYWYKTLQSCVNYQYYHRDTTSLSTAGMGTLVNQAQHQAKGIVTAILAAEKEVGKSNCPELSYFSVPAKIEEAKGTGFQYWISITNTVEGSSKPYKIPAKTFKTVKSALKKGWKLTSACEIRMKQGKPVARIYLKREEIKASPSTKVLGVDVGIRNSVSRSDGYRGKSLKPIIAKQKKARASRQRQGIKSRTDKTSVKQTLDLEARRAVARCKRHGWSLAFESPKVVGNLGRRNLQGWAAAYFARRASILAKEEGVWCTEVHPAYSSQTCSRCGTVEKQSRKGFQFCCVKCGHKDHADVNGAKVLSKRGTEKIARFSSRAVGPRK